MPSPCPTQEGDAVALKPDSCSVTNFAQKHSGKGRQRKPGKWLATGVLLLLAGRAAAALTLSDTTLDNAYTGVLTLTITGLNSNGQTVILEKFFDANNSSSINAGDVLMQRFRIMDGEVTSIGGRQNLNVPGDEDRTADRSIQTKLYFTPEEIPGRLDGRHIFRVSPDGAGFSPFTASLTINQKDYGGSGISGKVTVGAAGQSGAMVLIATAGSDDFEVVGITKTDGSGNYSLKLPPGTYRPVPTKTGFVSNVGAAPVVPVLSGAMTSSPNAVLTASSRTIAGATRDAAAPNSGLPGLLVFGQSSGYFSLTFSDASGNYVLDATPGEWDVGMLEEPLARLGMLHREGFSESSVVSVTGFNLEVPKATALIYGTVRTPANAPVPYVDLKAESDGDPEWRSNGFTDANGNYTLGAGPGVWQVELESRSHLAAEETANVSSAGSTVAHDVTAYPFTSHLRGQIKDNHNAPVGNVEIFAHDYQGTSSRTTADPNGFFDIGVFGGANGSAKTWSIQLNQGGDEPAAHVSTSPEFQVVDGTDINNINYLVYAVSAHLRGQVLDENNAALGNVNLFATSSVGGVLSGSNVEGDGNFDIPVFGGTWRIGLSNDSGSGLLAQTNAEVTVTDGVDRNGLTFRIHHTTGTFSGTVKNGQDNGLTGIGVSASVTVAGASFLSTATTGPGGAYSLPVFPETWQVSASGADLQLQGYQPTAPQNVMFSSGNVIVNFVATTGGQTYAAWQATKFTPAEAADPNKGGPNADFEKDGIVNLMEYALHLEPKIPDPNGLPVVGYQPPVGPAAAFLTLTFTRLTGSSGLAYNVQESTALNQTWNNVTAPYEVLSSDGITDVVRAKTPVQPGTKFLRLQVVQTGP